MYLNHTFAIQLYCHFFSTLQSIRSMGSFDVPLGPTPSCWSFVVLGTKRLLNFVCVHLAGHRLPILYARFRSSSFGQGLSLLLDYVAWIKVYCFFLLYFLPLSFRILQCGAKKNRCMALKVYNKVSFNIPKIPIKMCAKLKLLISWIPITIQGLVEEVSLSMVVGLVSNQCMAHLDDLLVIILPPKYGVHICLIDWVDSLAPIPN
jgi:hypothetical protein